jgi:hypothetical protein
MMAFALVTVIATHVYGALAVPEAAWAPAPEPEELGACGTGCTCDVGTLGTNRCDAARGPRSQSEADYNSWWNELRTWGEARRAQLAESQPQWGDFSAYDNPDIAWARTAFVQPQVMLHDRMLFDRETNQWTVDRYLDDLEERYGGIDAVLVWQGYPNLGADDQNCFDMLRNLPGGIPALRQMVDAMHERGVEVLFPNFLWDTQTRLEGKSQYEALASLVIEAGADGINGDTMDGLNQSFWDESVQLGKGLVLEAQSMGNRNVPTGWENVTYNVASWAERWSYPSGAPYVAAYKVIEPRHTQAITERSETNRTDGIQTAFFNGIAYNSWENVCEWRQHTPSALVGRLFRTRAHRIAAHLPAAALAGGRLQGASSTPSPGATRRRCAARPPSCGSSGTSSPGASSCRTCLFRCTRVSSPPSSATARGAREPAVSHLGIGPY